GRTAKVARAKLLLCHPSFHPDIDSKPLNKIRRNVMTHNLEEHYQLTRNTSPERTAYLLANMCRDVRSHPELAKNSSLAEIYIRALEIIRANPDVLQPETTPDGPPTGFGPAWYGQKSFDRLYAVSHLGGDLQFTPDQLASALRAAHSLLFETQIGTWFRASGDRAEVFRELFGTVLDLQQRCAALTRGASGDGTPRMPERPSTPLALNHCQYPSSAETERHGIQGPLPQELPIWDRNRLERYRGRMDATPLCDISPEAVLETVRVVAESFSQREPMCRHVRLPVLEPEALSTALHSDQFGTDTFGEWDVKSALTWFVRSFVLTDPSSSESPVPTNGDVLRFSLAIRDGRGDVVGGAFNETLLPCNEPKPLRSGDAIIEAVGVYMEPILSILAKQDEAAMAALSMAYPDFQAAYQAGQVGHHFMVARSESLPVEDTFELVIASMERFDDLGYQYVVIEATNQWTGAACEALGATAVHFAPYRTQQVIPSSPEPIIDSVSSSDGYISDKDSGSMFYVLRLK
ncbi:MAG: hypothetical protein KDD53_08205, partial [Bdellovibrionales bacterium]|nr:hypothetical protein [Bdellovibrionales bacterium]